MKNNNTFILNKIKWYTLNKYRNINKLLENRTVIYIYQENFLKNKAYYVGSTIQLIKRINSYLILYIKVQIII